jgi:tetratricopeptide (TPR) repeat protein
VSDKSLTRPVQIADRLEDAKVGSLVYVDERGQVQSSGRYRRDTVVRFAALGVFLGAANWLYWAIGGPAGLVIGGGLTFLVLRQVPAVFRLRRAVDLLVSERLDEAEALLQRMRGGWRLPTAIAAQVDQNLARVATLRGRHEEALAFEESALRRTPGNRANRARRRMLEFARVVTLVNLDRAGEARDRLSALPRALDGDYLRAQYAATELYVAFAEGHHDFDPAFLREQAEIAMSLPSARSLLALIAWAEQRAGRSAEAARLLALARERPGEAQVRQLMPRLAAWMDGRTDASTNE